MFIPAFVYSFTHLFIENSTFIECCDLGTTLVGLNRQTLIMELPLGCSQKISKQIDL